MNPRVYFLGPFSGNTTAIVQANNPIIIKTMILTNTLDDWADVQCCISNGADTIDIFTGQIEPKDIVLLESTIVLETGMTIFASGSGIKAYIAGVDYV